MTRIALVEDDVAIREALSDLLVQRGYEPVEICDWAHASQAVLDAAPDLVLLDLGLPGVDGTAICRELRDKSGIPIIVVTSRASEMDEVLAMTMGADDFITKPYSVYVLVAHIEALLRRSSQAQARPGPRSRTKGLRWTWRLPAPRPTARRWILRATSCGFLRILCTTQGRWFRVRPSCASSGTPRPTWMTTPSR